jgi:hypothetical protein
MRHREPPGRLEVAEVVGLPDGDLDAFHRGPCCRWHERMVRLPQPRLESGDLVAQRGLRLGLRLGLGGQVGQLREERPDLLRRRRRLGRVLRGPGLRVGTPRTAEGPGRDTPTGACSLRRRCFGRDSRGESTRSLAPGRGGR